MYYLGSPAVAADAANQRQSLPWETDGNAPLRMGRHCSPGRHFGSFADKKLIYGEGGTNGREYRNKKYPPVLVGLLRQMKNRFINFINQGINVKQVYTSPIKTQIRTYVEWLLSRLWK